MQNAWLSLLKNVFLFIACSNCFVQSARAQANFTIKPFTPGDGLVSADIMTLFQDSKNYLWIGHAAGVSRYDGYKFENFLFTAERQLGKTYSIVEDDLQHIWIGAENGLFIFSEGILRNIQVEDKPRPVYALSFDNNQSLWIGSSEGPSSFLKKEWQEAISSGRISLSKNIIPGWKEYFSKTMQAPFITTAKDGSAFIGIGYDVFRYWKGVLTHIWKSQGGHDPLKSIVALNKDSVYICSSYGGIQAFENGRSRKAPGKTGAGNAFVHQNNGYYYYSHEGVYAIDLPSLQATQLLPFSSSEWEWGSALLFDKENNFWIGTHEQLCYARRNFFKTVKQDALFGFDELYAVKSLRDGTMLVGGNRGKLFRSSHDAAFYQWLQLFPVAPITAIYEEEDGATWFASAYQGLALVNNKTTRRYTVDDGLRDNTNFIFLKTTRGELFTGGDNGVTRIRRIGEDVQFTNYSFNTGSTDYVIVRSGLEQPSGGLLFGSNRGLLVLKGDSLDLAPIKNFNRTQFNITDMRKDANGNVWISTLGDGILLCRFENDLLAMKKQLTTGDGLSSLLWLQLLIDANNIIWAAGYNGVARIEKTGDGRFFIAEYGRLQGLIPQLFHTAKMHQDRNGLAWLATSSGLMQFDPRRVVQSIYPSLQIANVTVTDEDAQKPMDTLPGSNAHLSYHTNSISFSWSGIYFSDPSSVVYSYRLIGQDTSWIDAGASRNISFRNLQPGAYRFEVKAAAGTNRWSPAAGFDFKIAPPFWQRWWFIAGCIVLTIALVFLVMNLYIDHIQRREEEKTRVQLLVSENLQYRLEIEKVISYFAASIAGKQTPDEILWDVARNCIARLGFEDCVIYLRDEQRNVLMQKAAWGPKTNEQNTILNPIEIPVGKGIVGSVAFTGKAEIVNDTRSDPRYIVDDTARGSEIAVPIVVDGVVIGVIDSEHSKKDFYTDRHLQILTTIASLCADKLVIMKAANERQQAQLEALYNKQKATEARLQSMRLQMNPHFLFNALNSIQQMILAGDETVATRCLSKFSKLLRLILIHSDKERVTLREELETLRLYIELEGYRFKDQFEYFVTCDTGIDQDDVRIPTLLIQPFVENAIWHGLMHKEGLRRLVVHFREQNETLICTVEDNGIGRVASQAIKERSMHETRHTGKGIAVARERLKIFGEHTGNGNHLEITDLVDRQGQAAGTRITLQFPV